MNKNKEEQKQEEFISYEEARIEKPNEEDPQEVSDENLEKINKILDPDEDSMESRR